MRKFNIRKVLDGLTAGSSSAAQPPPPAPPGSREPEVAETLQAEHFQLCKTVRHGFPYRPSALAFDPVQKILAVGTQLGALRLLQVHFQTTSTVASTSRVTAADLSSLLLKDYWMGTRARKEDKIFWCEKETL
ncbi:syntaxin-binding protein 5-like isoform X5 [Choloepus didactylus]|uniref:syntaxin-binding protein 5-like isoform X5 n=1 Tax=Choloepus didactylus TaxID=27675 RepID=UPI00189F3D65|nr:syntaxin-binding protein 5-like isoform X5 [Choloepus didactylus]